MSGYNYVWSKLTSKFQAPTTAAPSPVIGLQTFKRFANEQFDEMITNRKKAGYKLGDIVEYELPSFEQCGDDRQTMKECVGKDKEGNDVVFVLERFHVGGQAKERGIAVGGPAKKSRAKKPAKKKESAAPKAD